MASIYECLHSCGLYYCELSAAESRIPPSKVHSQEANFCRAKLRMLEELIILFTDITPNPTNDEATNNASPTEDIEILDLWLVTDILL